MCCACGYATYETNPRISVLGKVLFRSVDLLQRGGNYLTRLVLHEARV